MVFACDEHGEGMSDYMIEVLSQQADGSWAEFHEMSTDVHAYGPDSSYRCFHVRLPADTVGRGRQVAGAHQRVHRDGTAGYQGYSSDGKQLGSTAEPVEIELDDLGPGNGSMFCPFTTTMIQIVLNREPMPLDAVSRLLTFLEI